MKKQSRDFIIGYVFNRMETSVFKELKKIPATSDVAIGECEFIPKIWFGLSCSQDVRNDINGCEKHQLKVELEKLMTDILPKYETTVVRIVPDAQYIRFDYNVISKPTVKKMTVEEIEKELGYKIEIVSDN